MKITFDTLEHFYEDAPQRRTSGEADFGVHWKLDGWAHSWRVSYVRATGEVYAVNLNRTDGPLFILAAVSPDDTQDTRRGRYYDTLEDILEGWAERCGPPDSLRWVMERLREAGRAVSAG